MPRKARELAPVEVKRLTTPGLYAVGGVAGLHLQVTKSGARSWILRTTIAGKRRDLGLGGYPDVTLALAREKARDTREKIAQGIDPVAERQRLRSAALAERLRDMTFEKAAEAVVAKKQAEARNPKHGKQWASTLETYAYPVLGPMSVADIELAHVKQVLEPIWQTKTETATRVRQRIEAVLSWASVHGHRSGENPARWKGNLDAVLPAPTKVSKVEHHRAMPMDDMHDFMLALEKRKGIAPRCLAFVILTAVRSGEARAATWDEIDLAEKVWTIPGDRMKAGREHRVPLSAPAVELLEALPRFAGCNLIFPNTQGRKLSDATLAAVLKRMKLHETATVHGFRSTFRDWAAERTSTPHHVAEMALAHTIKNHAEAAYRRGDLLAKRAKLMQQWADFLATTPAKAKNVTAIRENKVAAE
ncbi:tyrosine-type recombinase/integrase [Modicisalibacter tunisiensis]|uniref:Integrase arm-type DNA-binding domain-containing protein n=1 Tax=Modicisalibacter tunisiensis TaxID=390637 RepID=A0ABS7X281_9GAMM|nr:site-specific integrase [Modicisalibacter tunisiensis]MBZ9568494.1 integrase arm-type DNA-binding domain-containing protein [Modicisalibacter tunisiensis]